MTASTALQQLLAPRLAGLRFQFGRWTDSAKTDRYVVLRPIVGEVPLKT